MTTTVIDINIYCYTREKSGKYKPAALGSQKKSDGKKCKRKKDNQKKKCINSFKLNIIILYL